MAPEGVESPLPLALCCCACASLGLPSRGFIFSGDPFCDFVSLHLILHALILKLGQYSDIMSGNKKIVMKCMYSEIF